MFMGALLYENRKDVPQNPIQLKHPREAKQDKFRGARKSVWAYRRKGGAALRRTGADGVMDGLFFSGILLSSGPSLIRESLRLPQQNNHEIATRILLCF